MSVSFGLPRQILLLPLFAALCAGHGATSHWDYLIFSQKWPASFCIHYRDGDPTRTCLMPEDSAEWTIHGIWPSRFEGEGPSFCDRSVPFDLEKIVPISRKLQKFWPNIEGGKSVDSLWSHEWTKHGTCAMDCQPLSGERKYFEGGLNLYATYNVTSLLKRINILPEKNKEYSVKTILYKTQKHLGKIPYVSCIKGMKSHKIYLSEIRLCFNKNIELIDCGQDALSGDFEGVSRPVTNCPVEGTIVYPEAEDHFPQWKQSPRQGTANAIR